MSEKGKEELPPPSATRALIQMLPLVILTWYLCNHGPDKNPKYRLNACGQNLHKIGVEIEKNRLLSEERLYNPKLAEIFGKNAMPECPVGGKEAYLNGYTVASDKKSYLMVCKGDHHTKAAVPPDFPRIAFSVEEASGGNSTEAEKPDEQQEVGQDQEKEEPKEQEVGTEDEGKGKVEKGKVEEDEVQKDQPEASPTPEVTPQSE